MSEEKKVPDYGDCIRRFTDLHITIFELGGTETALAKRMEASWSKAPRRKWERHIEAFLGYKL